jgi:hypothetical protein
LQIWRPGSLCLAVGAQARAAGAAVCGDLRRHICEAGLGQRRAEALFVGAGCPVSAMGSFGGCVGGARRIVWPADTRRPAAATRAWQTK